VERSGRRSVVVIPSSRRKAYKKLAAKVGKREAAAIAWKGRTVGGRSSMAKKAAKARKRGKRK
jgi:hypothetical protein